MNESTYLLQKERSSSNVLIYAVIAAFGGFVCGYDTGSISSIITLPRFKHYFYNNTLSIAYYESILLASYLATSMLGAFISGSLCDRKGRKTTILFSSYLLLLGISFEISGIGGIYSVQLGRLVGGLGTGLMTSGIPLYLSEISPSDIRGRLISTFSLLTSLGQMVGYFVTFASSYLQDDNLCWRLPWLMQFICCLLFASITLVYLPKSPRWLVNQGRLSDALRSLEILYDLPACNKQVQKEYSDIVTSAFEEGKGKDKSSFYDLFRSRNNRISTWIAFFISFANAMTGNVVVFYFAPQIFIKAMGNVSSSLALSGGVGLLSLLATAISLFYMIDRYGRRVLFIIGSALIGCCMMAIGILFQYFVHIDKSNEVVSSFMVIFFIYLFTTVYSSTWGVANYVYTAEIFTTPCRAKGLSLTYAISWASSILLTFTAPYLFAYSISGVYYFFAFCSLLTLIGVYFIPETRDKSLEDEIIYE